MTTLVQLRKKGREYGFSEQLKTLGFRLSPNGFWFYRQRGAYLDILDFWITSSGNFVDVAVVTFLDEMIDSAYDRSAFPKGFSKYIDNPTHLFAGRDGFREYASRWDISDDACIEQMFEKLYVLIEQEVNPWFLALTTREQVLLTVSPEIREACGWKI